MYGQIGLLQCVPQFVDEETKFFVRSEDICSAIKGSRCELNFETASAIALFRQRFEVLNSSTAIGTSLSCANS
jgi:hypothetical protein